MITDPDHRICISSMGWVDHDALWLFEATRGVERRISLQTGARHLSLHSGERGHFAVGHHFDGARFEVTVHAFSDSGRVLARMMTGPYRTRFEGDSAAWRNVPRCYVPYLRFFPWKDFVMVVIDPAEARLVVQRLGWYDDTYDKGYQGVTHAVEIRGEDAALVSIQRSSTVVVHDLRTGERRSTIDLDGRGGNPELQDSPSTGELWAGDYDTLVVLDRANHRHLRKRRLQDSDPGTKQFIGHFTLGRDGATCLVARPFSDDVLELDGPTLRTLRTADVSGQPLEVAYVDADHVVARDWKTGRLLEGTLQS